MNEGIYPNNPQQAQTPPPTIPEPTEPKPDYTIGNWITVFYLILLGVTFFNSDPDLSGFLFWVMLVLALCAAANFAKRMFGLERDMKNVIAKLFFALVGVGGAFVIFVIGFFFAVGNWFSTHPIQGD